MNWKPWEDFKQDAELLPISEPPCTGCKFFNPVREYHKGTIYMGVRICHANDMNHDFSCFRPKESLNIIPPNLEPAGWATVIKKESPYRGFIVVGDELSGFYKNPEEAYESSDRVIGLIQVWKRVEE